MTTFFMFFFLIGRQHSLCFGFLRGRGEGSQPSLCFCFLRGRKTTFFMFLFSERKEENILYVCFFWEEERQHSLCFCFLRGREKGIQPSLCFCFLRGRKTAFFMFLFSDRKVDYILYVFVFSWEGRQLSLCFCFLRGQEEGSQHSLCFCFLRGRKTAFFMFLFSERMEDNILYVFVF